MQPQFYSCSTVQCRSDLDHDPVLFAATRALCSSLRLCCAPATCRPDAAATHVLANGMRVIVKEDHRAPVVVSMVWYRAGSMDEVNGTTGVAHVLEHMMFKGTKKVPAGRVLAHHRRGRRPRQRVHQRATTPATSRSCTNRSCRSRCELEADRMANLLLSEDEFAQGDQGGDGRAALAHRRPRRARWCTSS